MAEALRSSTAETEAATARAAEMQAAADKATAERQAVVEAAKKVSLEAKEQASHSSNLLHVGKGWVDGWIGGGRGVMRPHSLIFSKTIRRDLNNPFHTRWSSGL